MRNSVTSLTILCTVALFYIGIPVVGNAQSSHVEPSIYGVNLYHQTSDDCEWGCFHWGYIGDRRYEVENVGRFDGHPYRVFTVRNESSNTLSVMSVSPSSYTGWGCGSSMWGRICNRLHRLEPGRRIIMAMMYGDRAGAVEFDFRFRDDAGNEYKFDDVLLSRTWDWNHRIRVPKVIYRGNALRVESEDGGINYRER